MAADRFFLPYLYFSFITRRREQRIVRGICVSRRWETIRWTKGGGGTRRNAAGDKIAQSMKRRREKEKRGMQSRMERNISQSCYAYTNVWMERIVCKSLYIFLDKLWIIYCACYFDRYERTKENRCIVCTHSIRIRWINCFLLLLVYTRVYTSRISFALWKQRGIITFPGQIGATWSQPSATVHEKEKEASASGGKQKGLEEMELLLRRKQREECGIRGNVPYVVQERY